MITFIIRISSFASRISIFVVRIKTFVIRLNISTLPINVFLDRRRTTNRPNEGKTLAGAPNTLRKAVAP